MSLTKIAIQIKFDNNRRRSFPSIHAAMKHTKRSKDWVIKRAFNANPNNPLCRMMYNNRLMVRRLSKRLSREVSNHSF